MRWNGFILSCLLIIVVCIGSLTYGAREHMSVREMIRQIDSTTGGVLTMLRDAYDGKPRLQLACEEAGVDCSYANRYHLVQRIENAVGAIFISTAYCWDPTGGCYIGTRHQNLRLAEMLMIPENQAILNAEEPDFRQWRIDSLFSNNGSPPIREQGTYGEEA